MKYMKWGLHPPAARHWLTISRNYITRGLLLLWLTFIAASSAVQARENTTIIAVMSEAQGPYLAVSNALRTNLRELMKPSQFRLEQIAVEDLPHTRLQDARLLIAIGSHASQQLDALDSSEPVLHLLIPSQGNQHCQHPNHSAIYIDQPWQRQLNLVHLTLPGSEHIGLLLGSTSQKLRESLESAISERQWYARVGLTASSGNYLDALKRILEHSEVLLAVPDQQVFNRQNLQGILLTSYRREVPMIGFSPGYVRAGALAAVYSTPEQIAQQAAHWVHRYLQGTETSLPPPSHPEIYSVAVNQQVARSLGLRVPQEDVLLQYMQQLEIQP